MTDQLLTAKDVAGRLQVSDKTVYAWARAGALTHFRRGGIIRFKAVDVQAFIEANTSAVNDARLKWGQKLT
jgi:excisionase family DNA binding protein